MSTITQNYNKRRLIKVTVKRTVPSILEADVHDNIPSLSQFNYIWNFFCSPPGPALAAMADEIQLLLTPKPFLFRRVAIFTY